MFHLFHREMVKKEREFMKAIQNLSIARSGLNLQVLANQKLVEGIMDSLVFALEAKDPNTQGHSLRVSRMAEATAKHIGLSAEECEQVRLAGLFHDIGKIGISDTILLKEGPLTDEEFEEIKRHPIYSYRILKPVDPFDNVLRGVLYHHENWDGSGYPYGISEDKIPLPAMIIHVVDSFDAMTSQRSYRDPMSNESALEEIRNKVGTMYKKEVAEAFLDAFEANKIPVRDRFREFAGENHGSVKNFVFPYV